MKQKKQAPWALATVTLAAILALGAFWWFHKMPAQPQPAPTQDVAQSATDAPHAAGPVQMPTDLWHADFPDLSGKRQVLSQWKGKVLVVNFWATWCPPCRAEVPDFIRAQKKYGGHGLQFVGIAVDHAADVKMFAKEFGINYPVLLGETGGLELAEAMGNVQEALPYTLVIDRKGHVVGSATGMLDPDKFGQLMKPLLGI